MIGGTPARAAGTGLIVNEFYGRGGSANQPYTHKFVELDNPTAAPISLSGLSIQYRSAGGTANATSRTELTGQVAPGGYFVLQLNSNGSTDPPTDPGPAAMSIAEIQGTGMTSAIVGRTVTTRGVVTAAYPTGGFNGFYLQTPARAVSRRAPAIPPTVSSRTGTPRSGSVAAMT